MLPTFADESVTHGTLLRDLGIINGEGGNLNEDGELKREELVAILVRIVDTGDVKLPAEPYFTDVPQDNWAAEVLEKAHVLGITDGISANTFGFGQVVDQQQATTFILKTLGYKPNWDTVIEDAKTQYQIEVTLPLDNFVRKHMFELTNKAMLTDMADGSGLLISKVAGPEDETRRVYTKKLIAKMNADTDIAGAAHEEANADLAIIGSGLFNQVMVATTDADLTKQINAINEMFFYNATKDDLFKFVGAEEKITFNFITSGKYTYEGTEYDHIDDYSGTVTKEKASAFITSTEGYADEVWDNEKFYSSENAFVYTFTTPIYKDHGIVNMPTFITILKNDDGSFSLTVHKEKYLVKGSIVDKK